MKHHNMGVVLKLVDALESSLYADELLREVYNELDEMDIKISDKLKYKLDLYFGIDDSE